MKIERTFLAIRLWLVTCISLGVGIAAYSLLTSYDTNVLTIFILVSFCAAIGSLPALFVLYIAIYKLEAAPFQKLKK